MVQHPLGSYGKSVGAPAEGRQEGIYLGGGGGFQKWIALGGGRGGLLWKIGVNNHSLCVLPVAVLVAVSCAGGGVATLFHTLDHSSWCLTLILVRAIH